MFDNLRIRLSLIFIGLAVGPLIFVGAFIGQHNYAILLQQSIDLQNNVAADVGSVIQGFIDQRENELDLLDTVHGLGVLEPDRQRSLLSNMLSNQGFYQELALLNLEGQEQFRLSRSEVILDSDLKTRADSEEFSIPIANGENFISSVRFNEMIREHLFTISLPLVDLRSGRITSVLVADVRFKPIQDLIADIELSSQQDVYVVDQFGKIVAYRNPTVVLSDTSINIPQTKARGKGLSGMEVIFATNTLRLSNGELIIVAEQSVSGAVRLATDSLWVTMITTFAALVVAVVLVFLVTRWIVGPIEKLAESARFISGGDLTHSVDVYGQDEIGQLSLAFNQMVSDLRESQSQIEHYTSELEARNEQLQTDINARKLTEEALKASEQRYRQLVSLARVGIYEFDLRSRRITDANDYMCEFSGYTREELLALDPHELLVEESRGKFVERQERFFSGEEVSGYVEYKVQRRNGETIWVAISDAFVIEDGIPIKVVAAAHDITERVQAEATMRRVHDELELRVQERTAELEQANLALQESDARFREMADNIREVFWLFDTTNQEVLYASPAYEEIWGRSIQDLYSRYDDWADSIYPEDLAFATESFERIYQTGGGEMREYRIVRPDGTVRWLSDRGFAICDEDGAVQRIAGIAEDITERKRAEEALREHEQHLSIVFNSVADGMVFTAIEPDGRYRILDLNQAFARIYGVDRAYAIGKTVDEMVSEEEYSYGHQKCDEAIQSKQNLRYERSFNTPVGSRIIESDLFPVFSQDDRCTHFLFVSRDITQRRQTERDRERLIAELQAKNTELEQFTYTVSHDLKAPLVTIMGFLSFLEQDALAGNFEQMQHDIARITSATSNMQKLLDDLLELSRMGRHINLTELVPFGQLAQEAVHMVTGRLIERTVEVEIAVELVQPDGPMIYGDRGRLRQVLENLVDNAIKFMGDQPHPRVKIGVRHDGAERVFCVQDNGIGIDPVYHEKVFGLFEKLDPECEGSGIGLAIVQRIIQMHGGRIWIESADAGQGSVFCFTLPSDWAPYSGVE